MPADSRCEKIKIVFEILLKIILFAIARIKQWKSAGEQFFVGSQKGGFQKGGFGGCSPAPKPGTRLHSDVPRHQKPERGYIRQNCPFTEPPFCCLSNF